MRKHTTYTRSFRMKKHLLALLSVGSLVALLPGCGSCCKNDKVEEVVVVEETANNEVAATEAIVSEAVPAQDVAAEATPAVEDKH